ncbi:hypothetical protein GH714_029442 [Hevea brasiliensis]|uniref:Uncharacterized protein n=1 Tax=Hevea brasiliensis TaxID=3981 RepID=A0A6A6K9A8_HEVBR|nr:hypothetical protein GH714_029442 [Hevea brasiliensis]
MMFSSSFVAYTDAVHFETLGPRELTGAVDLISHYKLLPHHEFFCKRSLPLSISDTHYLHNVVGDTEIRKGEGMQLDQLIQNIPYSRDSNTRIQPFDLDVLREAFQFKETTSIDLPHVYDSRNTYGSAGKWEFVLCKNKYPKTNRKALRWDLFWPRDV